MANSLRGYNLTYVSGASTSITGGAFNVDPVDGDTVLVALCGFENYSVSSVTDNASGNTYALVSGTRRYNGGTWVEIWQCQDVNTTSGFALTANYTGAAASRGIAGVAVGGAALSGAVDLASGQTQSGNQSGTDVLSTGALGTPSTDGQFVLAVAAGASTPDNFNPGTGFTGIGSYTYNQIWRVEYLIQGTAAAVAGTFSQDNTYSGGLWVASGCSVKAAGGGGGTAVPVFLHNLKMQGIA